MFYFTYYLHVKGKQQVKDSKLKTKGAYDKISPTIEQYMNLGDFLVRAKIN